MIAKKRMMILGLLIGLLPALVTAGIAATNVSVG